MRRIPSSEAARPDAPGQAWEEFADVRAADSDNSSLTRAGETTFSKDRLRRAFPPGLLPVASGRWACRGSPAVRGRRPRRSVPGRPAVASGGFAGVNFPRRGLVQAVGKLRQGAQG